jgi:hypothetical protein
VAGIEFRLDAAGVREVLRGPEMRAMVNTAAAGIAARTRARLPAGVPVQVRPYTTDRDAASVVIADVRGMAYQAREGVLTRAAADFGVEVRAWR